MRVGDYMRFAHKDVGSKPIRSMLAITSLALSALVLVVLTSISINTRKVINDQFGTSESLKTITVTSSKLAGVGSVYGNVTVNNEQNNTLTDETVRTLSAIEGVAFASPQSHVWEFSTFEVEGHSTSFTAQTEGIINQSSILLKTGRFFDESTDENEVILGAAYVKQLDVSPDSLIGRIITITTIDGYRGEGADILGPTASPEENDTFNKTPTILQARIVGVSEEGPGQNNLFISADWARRVRTATYWEYDPDKAARVGYSSRARFDQLGNLKVVDQIAQDGYTSIIVKADSESDVAGIVDAINRIGLGQVSLLEVQQKLNSLSIIVGIVLGSVALITLVSASIGIANTLLVVAHEQRYRTAVWRAIGAPRRQIITQFLLQAILLGFWGGLIGSSLGWLLSNYISNRISEALLNEGLHVVSVINVTPAIIVVGTLFTLLFSVVTSLYPSFSAGRTDISQALSSE